METLNLNNETLTNEQQKQRNEIMERWKNVPIEFFIEVADNDMQYKSNRKRFRGLRDKLNISTIGELIECFDFGNNDRSLINVTNARTIIQSLIYLYNINAMDSTGKEKCLGCYDPDLEYHFNYLLEMELEEDGHDISILELSKKIQKNLRINYIYTVEELVWNIKAGRNFSDIGGIDAEVYLDILRQLIDSGYMEDTDDIITFNGRHYKLSNSYERYSLYN